MVAELSQKCFLSDVAEDAKRQMSLLKFPSNKQDRWRFNQFNEFKKVSFTSSKKTKIHPNQIKNFRIHNSIRIVLVDGHFDDGLSDAFEGNILFSGLLNTVSTRPEAIESQLTKIAPYNDNYFTAENTARFHDGVFIKIGNNSEIQKIIHILNISTGGESFPRTLVIAEANSNASIVEHFISINEQNSITKSVTEIELNPNAHIDYLRLQDENNYTFHFSHFASKQNKDSRLSVNSITCGGKETINDSLNELSETGSEVSLYGIFMTDGNQFVDNHTQVIHAAPHTVSSENYKGILAGSSKAIFDGKIIVKQDSQKIESSQSNKNLLLSQNARIHSNPQLEINADDVKCSHGSTTGQLDEDAMFYLQSRGLSAKKSKKMLVEGFANDVIEKIKFEEIRNLISQKVFKLITQDHNN